MRTVDEVAKLVQANLGKITLPEIVEAIQPLLITPQMHMRNWDYGTPGEAFPCWTILEHKESGTDIVYSDFGFGPTSPWGLVFPPAKHNWFGMDSGWFNTLEEAFCESAAATKLPIWNLIKRYPNGTTEVVETLLSIDEVCEKIRNFTSSIQQSPEQPRYSMARRR